MKNIFQRLPLGRGMDILSYGYAFWVNQCTSGFHELNEPGVRDVFTQVSLHGLLMLLDLLKTEEDYEIIEVGVGVGCSKERIGSMSGAGNKKKFFKLLKDIGNAPILSLPDGPEDFVVNYDTSNQGLGCILMQRGKSSVKDKILAAPGEASKVENATAEILRGMDQLMERKEDGCMYFIWVPLIGDVRTLIMDEARSIEYNVGTFGSWSKDVNAETSKTFWFIATARVVMSADSAVTYTSVHSEARSWSIPSEDPYEEAAQQLLEQAPRSPEYIPDPMELEDHVPVYIPEPEHPEDLVPAEDEAPTPLLPPSFLSPRIRPLSPRALEVEMRDVASALYHSLHPSGTPPLLPIPLPAPSTSRRADIPEADTPPRKRLLLTTPRPGCGLERVLLLLLRDIP
ncbi:hypothetical protein Tco_0718295 [Tanacetum coccineum]